MTLITALAGIVLVSSPQDALRLERTFRAGDQDTYSVQLQATAESVNLDVAFKLRQTVKKVLGPGDAQVRSEISDFASSSNGESRKLDPSRNESAEFRLDSTGMPKLVGSRCPIAMRFVQYAGLLGDQPLRQGHAIECSLLTAKASAKASGRVVLENFEAGIAKLVSNWRIEAEGESPVKIDLTSFVEKSTGKLVRASGTIVPEAKGAPVLAIQFSIQRENK